MADDRERMIPLHEEHLSVDKRAIERGRVRVAVRVREHEETAAQVLRRQDVDIERVPMGHPVETMPEPRREGDILIIPVVEEEVVISKRLVLREEIHVRTRTSERTEQVAVTLRSQEADITRIDAPDEHMPDDP